MVRVLLIVGTLFVALYPNGSLATENWLLGDWKAPQAACPPEKGMRYTKDKVTQFTAYLFGVNVVCDVNYKFVGDIITTREVCKDGTGSSIVYRRIDEMKISVIQQYGLSGIRQSFGVGLQYVMCK